MSSYEVYGMHLIFHSFSYDIRILIDKFFSYVIARELFCNYNLCSDEDIQLMFRKIASKEGQNLLNVINQNVSKILLKNYNEESSLRFVFHRGRSVSVGLSKLNDSRLISLLISPLESLINSACGHGMHSNSRQ